MEAQPVGGVTQGMESGDGVLRVVGVDVQEAALRTHGDVRVVSQGLDRGAARLGAWSFGAAWERRLERGVMRLCPSATDSR